MVQGDEAIPNTLYFVAQRCYNHSIMTRSGFVAICGRPNVGKSTIINGLVKEKVAITSSKPETTRDNVRGILSGGEFQIVFVDSPGIHKPHDLLGKMMLSRAESSIMESDIVLFITEKHMIFGKDDENIRERLVTSAGDKKVILVINKSDRVKDKRSLLPIIQKARDFYPFDEIYPMSALNPDDLEGLLKIVKTYLPEGPFLYPEDQLTDKSDAFMISEIIREKILERTFREIPHSVAVTVEAMEERTPGGMLEVSAVIFVERTSQKSILIGKSGEMMKKIGESARKEIEPLLSRKIWLSLWVKVAEKWKKNPSSLRELGYSDE
jgi:GTPase